MDLAAVAQQTTTTGGDHIITAASKDPSNNNIVIKGKRTKRQRPPAINNVTNNHHSSTSYNAFNSNSPASSSEFPASSTTTEDEDTAKCLILLSKGHHQVVVSPRNNVVDDFSTGYKFNSKRFIQTTSTEGLTGIYVYQCKTCSRTFPSFQALGGHRASHKKPRISNELDKRIKPPPYTTAFSDEDEPSQLKKNNSPSNSSSLSLQLINHRVSSYPVNITKKLSSSNKLHECSICGAEFNSGQALGGHMRRHRAANGNTTTTSAAFTATNTTQSLIPYSPVVAEYDEDDNQKSRINDGLYLDLDLNLPAPSEATTVSNLDQHRESTLKFTANQKKQQPAVHLSATPTLVDCHY